MTGDEGKGDAAHVRRQVAWDAAHHGTKAGRTLAFAPARAKMRPTWL